MGKRELVSSWCLVTVSVLWLFCTVPCVGLRCMIVVFPDHNHLLFSIDCSTYRMCDQRWLRGAVLLESSLLAYIGQLASENKISKVF